MIGIVRVHGFVVFGIDHQDTPVCLAVLIPADHRFDLGGQVVARTGWRRQKKNRTENQRAANSRHELLPKS